MAGYQVVTAALRQECAKWEDFASATDNVKPQVTSATLSAASFFVGDPTVLAISFDATVHQAAYEQFRSFVEARLTEATAEFMDISGALQEMAERYDEAEEIAEIDLNEIFTKGLTFIEGRKRIGDNQGGGR